MKSPAFYAALDKILAPHRSSTFELRDTVHEGRPALEVGPEDSRVVWGLIWLDKNGRLQWVKK